MGLLFKVDIMAEYQIIKTGGFVNIKDISTPESFAKLDFTGAVGSFYTRLGSDSGGPANSNTLTIVHAVAGEILTGTVDEFITPSDTSLIVLRPVIDALLNTPSSSTPAVPMEPINTVYVSGVQGSPTGTGAIDSPINTITDAITLASTNSIADGIPWCVYVFSGTYDEQILVPASADPIWITLGCGAEVIFSGGGGTAPTIDATNGDTYITMQQGSVLANTGIGAVLYPDVNDIVLFGNGTIRMDSPYQLIDMTATGGLTLRDVTLLNTDPANTVELSNQTSGVLRMVNCNIVHVSANDPMVKSGGDARLYGCNIYAPLSTNSISSPTPQKVQIVNCTSNLAVGASITQLVGTLLVDAAFQL
jgi:hypothetical protein